MYELALRLIAENKKTRALSLDLGKCGLTELPEELGELVWLEELILSNLWGEYDPEKREWEEKTSKNNGRPNCIASIAGIEKLIHLKILITSNEGEVEKWPLLDLSPLSGLTSLQQLDCSCTQVSDLSPLSDLLNLQVFWCYSTQVSDLLPLSVLVNLQELRCDYTHVSDLSPLSGLVNLQQLDCSSTQVSDLSPLSDLLNLQGLRCYSTQVSDLLPLSDLVYLQHLSCDSTHVSDLSPLSSLKNLQQLNCDSTHVSDLFPLSGLLNLRGLSCASTKISDLSPLSGLVNLRGLLCASTQVSDLSPLSSLLNLRGLWCLSTQVSNLFPLLDLVNLQQLDCSSTRVSDLSPLSSLLNLQELWCSHTQVSDLSPLSDLLNLRGLWCLFTRVSDLSPLSGLVNLQQLSCSHTRVSDLSPLWALPRLATLYASNNPIPHIPKSLLQDNVLPGLPNYLRDLEAGSKPNDTLKLVLIGNGRVGKTCLLRRLLYNEPSQDQESTHGIQLHPWPLPDDIGTLHCWDFGGQDIYHTTHRLFLRTEAIFLLVYDEVTEWGPDTQTETLPGGVVLTYDVHRLSYWLQYIKNLGNSSPVLLVQTQTKRPGHHERPPDHYTELKKQYPNIVGLHHVDSGIPPTGIATLRAAIGELAYDRMLNHEHILLPLSWQWVRSQIWERAKAERFLSRYDFEMLCMNSEWPITNTETVLGWLHDTGVLFYQEGLFSGRIILDQQFAIDAVYALLNRQSTLPKLIQRGFKSFKITDLEADWGNYDLEERVLFLSFMTNCALCYVTPQTRHLPQTEQEYIAPQLLPTEPPGSVGALLRRVAATAEVLEYCYEFLHDGVMLGFLVQTGALESVQVQEQWRYGTLLSEANTDAVVQAFPKENRIRLTIEGSESRMLLQKIRNVFRKIHDDLDVLECVSVQGQPLVSLASVAENRHLPEFTYEGHVYRTAEYRFMLNVDEKVVFESNKPLSTMEKQPVKVFISYSHKDEAFKERFDRALKPLKRLNLIDVWQDRLLLAGEIFEKSIFSEIGKAEVVCLLVSPDFFESDYCFSKEMEAALKQQSTNGTVVVPIILRSTPLWHKFEIGTLNALPKDGKPITDWTDPDAAWTNVVEKIYQLVEHRRKD